MVVDEEVQLGLARFMQHPDVDALHLYDEEAVLVVHPSHPFAKAGAERARARRATADMTKAVVVSLQDISRKALEGDAEAQTTIVNLAASQQFSSLLESVAGGGN